MTGGDIGRVVGPMRIICVRGSPGMSPITVVPGVIASLALLRPFASALRSEGRGNSAQESVRRYGPGGARGRIGTPA
jgi:hypothetical protein